MKIAALMATPAGRLVRVALGIALIIAGIMLGGAGGWIVATIGLVPIAAGTANVCLVAPILHAPFKGGDAAR